MVKDRLDSDVYLDQLGIVHQAQQDLDRLSESIYNQYQREFNHSYDSDPKYYKDYESSKESPTNSEDVAKKNVIRYLKRVLGCQGKDDEKDKNIAEKSQVQKKKKKLFPRGRPRIVLFIDDLDRCEPDKVVEVLEAIQLLVKTNLFVVIVAIDPRYVCLSLENKEKYRHILHTFKSPTSMEFLEKIIQIPYRLPSIDDESMDRMVLSQIKKENKSNDKTDSSDAGEEKPSAAEAKTPRKEVVDRQNENQLGSDVVGDGSADTVEEANSSGSSTDRADKNTRSANDVANINAESRAPVKVTFEEQEFTEYEARILMNACKSFKLVPRSVTRVVNVYKVMKMKWHEIGTSYDEVKVLAEHYLLLLVMASSEEISLGMQRILNMMENPRSSLEGDRPDNLFDLLKDKCELTDSSDDLLKGFKEYPTKTPEEWRETVKTFEVVRSFSFFRTVEEETKENGTAP